MGHSGGDGEAVPGQDHLSQQFVSSSRSKWLGTNVQRKQNMMMKTGLFLTEWEISYFFVARNGKPFCLICQASLAHFKAPNLHRHFSSLHANIEQEYPKGTELRKHKLVTLKSQAEKQKQVLKNVTKHSETVTLASYQLAWNIARAKKPYNEGELIKKCLSNVVEILSPENDKLNEWYQTSNCPATLLNTEYRTLTQLLNISCTQTFKHVSFLVLHWMRAVTYKTSLS